LAAPPSGVRAEVVDRVVAAIDAEPVTQYELGRWGQRRGLGEQPTREMLDAYVIEALIAKEATAKGVAVGEAEVDDYIERVKTREGLDPTALSNALQAQGTTVAAYRENVRAELLRSMLVEREIRARVSVSPEEVRRYYDAHADEYSLAERIKLRMILIGAPPDASAADIAQIEALVRGLYAELEAGADFAEVARRYSTGPGAADGGDIGWFARGQMTPGLEEFAFRLRPGELSAPIRTQGGYAILKAEAREGSIPLAFEAVEAEIRTELYQEALTRRYDEWVRTGLRETHHVEILW
jgi:peptidyl-prolyl cis-trans isomerase SurA